MRMQMQMMYFKLYDNMIHISEDPHVHSLKQGKVRQGEVNK